MEKKLGEQAEAKEAAAQKLQICSKANAIAEYLGNDSPISDDDRRDYRVHSHRSYKGEHFVVEEVKGNAFASRTTISYYAKKVFEESHLGIEVFVPGKWTGKLDVLYKRAQRTKKVLEMKEQRKKREEEEKKKKWERKRLGL